MQIYSINPTLNHNFKDFILVRLMLLNERHKNVYKFN